MRASINPSNFRSGIFGIKGTRATLEIGGIAS